MRAAGRLVLSSFLIMFAAGPVQIGLAAEAIMLRAGEATGPNAVFAFDKEAKPHRIIVRTTQVGVAGSRIELCWILGDGVDQAADISWFATSISSRNFTPRAIFGN